MNSRIGQQFGNYRLLQQLGEGGFAEVYLGEHIHLNTPAAIKILHTQLATDDIEPFRVEARMIARLIHPHIVRVLEFGVEGRIPYLVMDYAPNGTLRQRHPKGIPLPLDTVVGYVKQLADALQFAHDEKLIHRDVKPENMLIGRRQEILLSDFGIALVAQSSRYQATQDMAGTISYMAPEQIQAHPRPASDQYSLGIVTYEWLSGDRPFHGSFTEIAIKHSIVPPPSLREKLPTLPIDVEQVVLTALAKDYKERFGSIQAFSTALEQASRPGSAQAPSIRPPVHLPPPQPAITPPDKAIPPTHSPLQTSPTESFIQTELVKQPSGSMPSNTPAQSSSQAQVTPSQPPSSASHTPPLPETRVPTDNTVELPAQERGREKYGIERISPKTRPHVRIFDNFTFWLSASLGVPAFTLGTLATSTQYGFGLSFGASVLTILAFNLFGIFPVALLSTLGPQLGLRQAIISRFSFGRVGARIIALLTALLCIYGSVITITFSTARSDPAGSTPDILIVLGAAIVSILGYRYIHNFARFAWIPVAVVFLLLLVVAAPHLTIFSPPSFMWPAMVSYGVVIYTSIIFWSILATDYNVRQPEQTPTRRIFWLTFLGIFLPTTLLEIFGAAIITQNTDFSSLDYFFVGLFGSNGLSFALMLILFAGLITNIFPFIYSFGLAMQSMTIHFQRINRSVWTLIGAIICITLVLVNDRLLLIQSILSLLTYCISPWITILIIEHLRFRRGRYNAEDWNTRNKLPAGRAALISLLIGLFGAYLGLPQGAFYGLGLPSDVGGPIGTLLNTDAAWLLGILFAGAAYLILRWMELKKSGR